MDKLEKAMQKARQQRNQNIGNFEYAKNKSEKGMAYNPPSDTKITEISEKQLNLARIVSHKSQDKKADIFRLLRTQVLQTMNREGFKSLAITSPNYGDGKTTIALNLAVSIAQDLKQTVLLADLDLRKPNLHSYLGIDVKTGLSDYLLNDTPIPQCLYRLSFERLSILPAGASIENSSEVLGLPKMAALAHELKTRYPDRFIIYDMPPVLEQDDPLAFIPHVDCALMVAREGKTKTTEVTQCLEILSSAKIIGTVLNETI